MKRKGQKKSRVISEQAILKTIKGGAKTLTDVVHGLGYSSVCGSTTKKIKAAVPDIQERLKSGNSAIKVEAPAKVKPVAKVKPAKKVAKVEKTEVVRKQRKFSGGIPYGEGTLCRAIVEVASKGEMTNSECDKAVAEITGKTVECVAMCRCWVSNKNHKSNKGKTQNVASERGRIHIRVLQGASA